MSLAGSTRDDTRPAIAVVAHVQAPYRLQVHRRIASELPEVRLHTAYLREENDQPWVHQQDVATHPAQFGPGQSVVNHRPTRDAIADYLKGGRLIAWFKRHNIRAVMMGGYADAARIRAILWCHRNRVPCFLTGDSNIRADVATGVKRLVKDWFVPFICERCSLMMPFGRRGHEYFRRYGVSDDRLAYFPYEPDYNLIHDLPPEQLISVRDRFGLPHGRRRMVVCGRLATVKRVDLAINAFLSIAEDRPSWDLVLVGGGPLLNDLRARVPGPFRSRVIFTDFLAETADIAAVLKCCHILVHPAQWEPWGLVLNEAAAAGLAIVASDVTGAAGDLIEEGANGRTFASQDGNALKRCLLEVSDPVNIARMQGASARVLADYRQRADPVANLRQALSRFHVV